MAKEQEEYKENSKLLCEANLSIKELDKLADLMEIGYDKSSIDDKDELIMILALGSKDKILKGLKELKNERLIKNHTLTIFL